VRTSPPATGRQARRSWTRSSSFASSRATGFELSEADRAVGALAGLGARLPNPHLLIRPYLRREAVASTRIEGTQSSLSDVLSAEAQLLVETEDQREVLNYVRAFEHGLVRLPSLPLSKRLIREMHAELLARVRGEEATPGEFRRSQNWLGGTNPSNALFVPPPVDLLEDALDDFEAFLHDDLRIPLLVRCALAHFQFETIHPFLDGNGRLGRLLVNPCSISPPISSGIGTSTSVLCKACESAGTWTTGSPSSCAALKRKRARRSMPPIPCFGCVRTFADVYGKHGLAVERPMRPRR
jgi:fido (protein-threonine AMPylation protein)